MKSKDFWAKIREIDYRHYICAGIALSCVLCTVFIIPASIFRFFEGGRDFGLSVAYYFCEIFGIDGGITPTVNNLPIPFPPASVGGSGGSDGVPSVPVLPETFDGFKVKMAVYWRSLWNLETAATYIGGFGHFMYILGQVILLLVPLLVLFFFLFRRCLSRENTDTGHDSKPLRAFLWLSARTYHPVKAWLSGFIGFCREHRFYFKLWLCIWLFSFNVFTILLEFLAYYLYFVVSFDFFHLYVQVYKLCLDLIPAIRFIPLAFWLVLGLWLFNRFRRKIGFAGLQHCEMQNRGFINSLPIVVMINATMGMGKTTILTDMLLSKSAMFRDKARNALFENAMKFPYFPWAVFENVLRYAIGYGHFYGLATCEKWVLKKRERFERSPSSGNLYGYDYVRYGLTYKDNLAVVSLWEVLEAYAKEYYIYTFQTSYILSNYAVREDAICIDRGNFPLWDTDFFHRSPRMQADYSIYSHVLDFDMLRLGRKVREDNPRADAYEWGLIGITEIGKERGNSLENKEFKANDKEANPKNDLMSAWLKMVRHSATVDNYPYVLVLTDEQRAMSWGADARDLCKLVNIVESPDFKLTMPFYALEDLLHDVVISRFQNLYEQFRHCRGDNTLFMHIMKTVISKLHARHVRIQNQFGVRASVVETQMGTLDGNVSKHNYFIMKKKDYANRFATDCLGDFFREKALRSSVGLGDIPAYRSHRATFAELGEQHSYFVMDLLEHLNSNQS